jgi:hypothetical protein
MELGSLGRTSQGVGQVIETRAPAPSFAYVASLMNASSAGVATVFSQTKSG